MIVSRAAAHLDQQPGPLAEPTPKLVPANEFARRILELLAERPRPEQPAAGGAPGQEPVGGRQVPVASASGLSAGFSVAADFPEPERWDEIFDWQASAEAYWSRQPEEVRRLRNVEDLREREALAAELAAKGHTIDVPIMVWGSDPLRVMLLRRLYGYTWVPSALQPSVAVAPGIEFPGLPAYDATQPPAGSILVDLSFAQLRPGARAEAS
ncbi:MAG: hypothetical protein K6T59_08975 [Bryobacteraceae bacterium]|nr:hypothetical protein [Bryobacteraceae bacterium]